MTTTSVTAPIATHLPLVGHVVSQLDARYPRHVDRPLLWTLGAWGLVSAVERLDPGSPSFATETLRAVRDVIVHATRVGSPDLRVCDADDRELAEALGITVGQLQVLRRRSLPSQECAAAAHVAAARASRRQATASRPAMAAAPRQAAAV